MTGGRAWGPPRKAAIKHFRKCPSPPTQGLALANRMGVEETAGKASGAPLAPRRALLEKGCPAGDPGSRAEPPHKHIQGPHA